MPSKKVPAPSGYPLFGWTPEAVREHMLAKPVEAGDLMIIYNAHGGVHSYTLAQVVQPAAGRQRPVVLSKAGLSGGTAFYRTGINVFMPKGRTRMIPPVPALMAHLRLDCDVVLDVPLYG